MQKSGSKLGKEWHARRAERNEKRGDSGFLKHKEIRLFQKEKWLVKTIGQFFGSKNIFFQKNESKKMSKCGNCERPAVENDGVTCAKCGSHCCSDCYQILDMAMQQANEKEMKAKMSYSNFEMPAKFKSFTEWGKLVMRHEAVNIDHSDKHGNPICDRCSFSDSDDDEVASAMTLC